ncbi:hypothetical protein GUITHDRAFT_142362 [Guillardia theta CCMP2712]|uniref:Uncharacterized protein n=1 Tax=Guillardia theta (strain CCMP2712) TaxID=905079 RepID=L1IXY7_GUITC|nr:hypothetical protein GUITHDRAFT_142362 [Guillardia theta CCMP2712]EKX40962.1 hypothetical protein GUITHDRAFT_142362 [Guillardia theta CCMP2712]|eukprot:XP_005827942.1 hypothetical protein GUITHDRAFT_142362 [Guillardia theta CCMP2712]
MEEAVPLVRPRMKEVERRRGGGAVAALAAASLLVLVAVAVHGGSSGSRGVRRGVLAESQAEDAYKELKRVLKEDSHSGQKLSMQKLQEAAAPAADAAAPAPADAAAAPAAAPTPEAAAPAKDESPIMDPEEAKKKAAEMANKAGDALNKAEHDLMDAVDDVLPGGDLLSALGWHLDLCVYLITMYAIYYIWKCEIWQKFLPKFKWDEDSSAANDKNIKLNQKHSKIGTWSDNPHDNLPNDQDLLWFRTAHGEELYWSESKRVLPGFIDTLMCGCGGNVYALAVTSKRIVIQNDKRCLFGSTVLTTNEESIFHEHVHKASLHTDGSLNLGICTLHSSEMLSGGFNWIFLGFFVDIVLEWKPSLLKFITDDRLVGWINMVPNDVIYMVSSIMVLFGAFLFVALLWFLLVPQSVLEVEYVKQAGVKTYTKKFELPVREAYLMHDHIMRGICERV